MKFLKVTFSNGETYRIALRHIAENAAKYYAGKDGFDNQEYVKVWRQEFDTIMENSCTATEWARSSMNWEDVERYAKKIETPSDIDFEDEWCNAEVEVMDQ